MPATAETQAPPQEATQPRTEQHEDYTGRERLTHEELRKVFAEVAILLILSAQYKVAEAATKPDGRMKMPGLADMNEVSNEAILFGLLVNALNYKEPEQPADWQAFTYSRPSFYTFDNSNIYRGFFGKSDTGSGTSASSRAPQADAPRAPRQPRSYNFGHGQSAPASETPKASASMSNVELGPELPPLPFNDRIRPDSAIKRPSQADFAAAKRANEMYQRALWDSGWRGGEATPQQAKAASRGMVRQGHSFDATPADAEAFKMFNSHNASKGKQGTGPVNTERSARSAEPESKSAETPTPEPAPAPNAGPSADATGTSSE